MKRSLLRFENLQQLVEADGLGVILLTDELRQRGLTVVCDQQIMAQLQMRINNPKSCHHMLPEVLLSQLTSQYEMMVCGVYEGQYQVILMDEIGNTSRIRMSDAVLLILISKIPLYIEENLMNRQCFPYNEKTQYQLSIPINTMNLDHLKRELEKAVDEENYELASHLRDEIKRRNERV